MYVFVFDNLKLQGINPKQELQNVEKPKPKAQAMAPSEASGQTSVSEYDRERALNCIDS